MKGSWSVLLQVYHRNSPLKPLHIEDYKAWVSFPECLCVCVCVCVFTPTDGLGEAKLFKTFP